MADAPNDATSQLGQGINWLVGLSGGAIGGALLKFDWLLKLSPAAKKSFFAAAIFFFASILCGAYYLFQLFAMRRRKDELDDIKSNWPPDTGEIDQATKAFEKARKKARIYHYLTMLTFGVASIASLFAIRYALFRASNLSEKPLSNKYLITTALVHLKSGSLHSHTFLLNQQTGEIWELTCRSNGTVEFRRVPKTSYDGSAEEPPASQTRNFPKK